MPWTRRTGPEPCLGLAPSDESALVATWSVAPGRQSGRWSWDAARHAAPARLSYIVGVCGSPASTWSWRPGWSRYGKVSRPTPELVCEGPPAGIVRRGYPEAKETASGARDGQAAVRHTRRSGAASGAAVIRPSAQRIRKEKWELSDEDRSLWAVCSTTGKLIYISKDEAQAHMAHLWLTAGHDGLSIYPCSADPDRPLHFHLGRLRSDTISRPKWSRP
jgi:hypothetical protein